MRDFLGREFPAFSPESVTLMADAFDAAWAVLAGGEAVNEGNREATRTALARQIVDLAGKNEYDRLGLCNAALAAFGIPNPD